MSKFFSYIFCITSFIYITAMEKIEPLSSFDSIEALRAKVQLVSLRTKILTQAYVSPRDVTAAIFPVAVSATPASRRFISSPRARLIACSKSPQNPYSPRHVSPRTWNSPQLLEIILDFYSSRLGQTDNPERIKQMLEDYSKRFTIPPIHHCANVSNIIFAQWLKAQNPQLLSQRDDLGRHPLHEASDVHFAQWLLEELTKNIEEDNVPERLEIIDAVDNQGRTPLFMAALSDFPELVNFLLEKRTNFYQKDATGGTVLHFGIGSSKILMSILNALSSRFNDKQQTDKEKTLQAFVNIADKNLQTPLHLVCKKNNCQEEEKIEIVRLLLEAHADANRIDTDGKTPLHILIEDPYCSLRVKQVIGTMIINAGADVNSKDKTGLTILHKLMQTQMYPDTHILAEFLIGYGAGIKIPDNNNITALALAGKSSLPKKPSSSSQIYTLSLDTTVLDQKTNIPITLARALKKYRKEFKEKTRKMRVKKKKKATKDKKKL